MDKTVSEILRAIPEKPHRSKLEPYYELIRELRRRFRTYREIARILEEHVGLRVDHSTICDFVRLRARRARTGRPVDQLPPRALPAEPPIRSTASPAIDGTVDAYARIEALKRRKPISQPAEEGFQYEEGAPLRLVSDMGKK